MKKPRDKTHSDKLFCQGFTVHLLMKSFQDLDSFEEYVEEIDRHWHGFPEYKDLIFKITKIMMLNPVLEHHLINLLEKKYLVSSQKIQDRVKNEIVSKTSRLNKQDEKGAIDLISKQQCGRDVWITSPVLLYVAGYTLGDLAELYKTLFSQDSLYKLLIKYKDGRNIVIHIQTTSRLDIFEVVNNTNDLQVKILDIVNEIEMTVSSGHPTSGEKRCQEPLNPTTTNSKKKKGVRKKGGKKGEKRCQEPLNPTTTNSKNANQIKTKILP